MNARQIGQLLTKAFTCPTCGKSKLLLNTAPRFGMRTAHVEAFDPNRHCACKPEPATTEEK